MAFIDKIDYETIIADNILDDITEIDDAKIDVAETRAIEFMSGFLNNRYDVENIFNKTGAERNPVILGYAMDITIYYLHRLVNWRNAPATRVNAYTEAKEWLVKVSELQINPPNLPFLPEGEKDYIQFGGNDKRTNHI
ncbi:phage protein Gp36 family protein [Aurantibacillus circumpalustris]|uniref:phage protein Gp36 family protein n=1 Tax=Aurantibacillus circumpalustris TaxID=3036359 RepID=UPI00295B2542|nr:phage protein Gp36 family protein [Aurantibacillus circumpalustris]